MSNVGKDKKMATMIAQKVHDLGGRTFYVGGYVRDELIGKSNKDIDIEIHGVTLEQLQGILQELGKLDERKVGDNFGIFALKGYDVDIALPRAEKPSEGGGHKDFIIDVDPFIGYENAARRRDFTINALMKDVLTGEVLDYFGGIEDLKKGVIRHVDANTFVDDPLRVLRAAQFASRFDFKIADDTANLSSQVSLDKLSQERIAGELSKALLKADKPSVFFDELRRVNQLDLWFPEVKALIDVPQDPEHHPEGDVYTHIMLVVDEAAKNRDKVENSLYFMVSALCHDFGKATTTEFDEERQKWKSWQHHEAGVPLASQFVNRVFRETKMREYVTEMTRYHMKPFMMYNEKSSQYKWMTFFDELRHPDELLLLSTCDSNGRLYIKDHSDREEYLSEKLNDYRELMKQPEIMGRDLLDMGYKPGPDFSKMIEFTHKNHLKGISKEDSIERMIAAFGPSDKLKELRANDVTGADLIKLGYKPGPKFAEMLDYVHGDDFKDLDKEHRLQHMIDKFGESGYVAMKRKTSGNERLIPDIIDTGDEDHQRGD